MNINPFIENYKNSLVIADNTKTSTTNYKEIDELFSKYGGLSVDLGVFKIHTYSSSNKWTTIIADTFPDYKDKIIVFGFDWLGKQYARHISEEIVYMFDIATRQVFLLETNVETFFNVDLIEFANDTIQTEMFLEWNKEKKHIKFNQIVGFKIPLFLGGKDTIDNYELIDAEVDWEINKQIRDKIE